MFIEVHPDFRDNFQSLAGTSDSKKNQVLVVYFQVYLLHIISVYPSAKHSCLFSYNTWEVNLFYWIILLTLILRANDLPRQSKKSLLHLTLLG